MWFLACTSTCRITDSLPKSHPLGRYWQAVPGRVGGGGVEGWRGGQEVPPIHSGTSMAGLAVSLRCQVPVPDWSGAPWPLPCQSLVTTAVSAGSRAAGHNPLTSFGGFILTHLGGCAVVQWADSPRRSPGCVYKFLLLYRCFTLCYSLANPNGQMGRISLLYQHTLWLSLLPPLCFDPKLMGRGTHLKGFGT